MGYFNQQFGFVETDRKTVHENLEIKGSTLRSLVNGREFRIGSLTTPSLSELRASATAATGQLTVREIVADAQDLHRYPESAGALFQVASQFNLLEMVSPEDTPDQGISNYAFDKTQGPACAIACAAGTVYRNWFVPLDGQVGQSAGKQIDCLADMTAPLGSGHWTMQNGYAIATAEGLDSISRTLDDLSASERDEAMGYLRVGLQQDTEVTLDGAGHLVTQLYGSALPVGYSPLESGLWESFARLILDASYESTLRVAASNAERTGNRTVYLTLLGGGAFGNEMSWIISAVRRALDCMSTANLDVAIVSYGSSTPAVTELIRQHGSDT